MQTTLTPAQEAVAVLLSKTLPVSLDGLLAVVRDFLNLDVSRSRLDQCLRQHGVCNPRNLKAKATRSILGDKKEFTNYLFWQRTGAQSGKHEFGNPCVELGAERRLTPRRPLKVNAMV